MRLIDRRTPSKPVAPTDDYEKLKSDMHKFVIDRIEDDKIIYDDNQKKLEEAISAYIRQYCRIYEATIDRETFMSLEKHLFAEPTR